MESDDEIEYMDEDADIVQQCVQTVPPPEITALVEVKKKPKVPLLVERTASERKRKRKKQEDDSDYDPNDDVSPPSPPEKKSKKKMQPLKKSAKSVPKTEDQESLKNKRKKFGQKKLHVKIENIDRRQCNIKIPDYDDPLCLPVKAITGEENDKKKLNNWNDVCLEHFKHCDTLLKPERGETKGSSRTIVFKNDVNKQTGKIETTIWSKMCVENEDGDKKSEIFRCVLPKYKEKKMLSLNNFSSRKQKSVPTRREMILTKEEHKDGEVLVVYDPEESLSAVYKMTRKSSETDEVDDKNSDEEEKVYLKETVCCKVCAPCYQVSWRGVKKNEQRKSIDCPICGRTQVTVHTLMTHLKTHSTEDVRDYKKLISGALSNILEYHYKCRICGQKVSSITMLLQHLKTHQGVKTFKCEICNNITS